MSLNEKKINTLLGDLSKNLQLLVYKTIDSTNTAAKRLGDSKLCKRAVLIASEQTSGRGRLGRSFVSADKKGLYLSILLGEELPAEFATSLTTYMAVMAARAIDSLSGLKVDIKWVNDIYSGGKKLAGILTEGKASDNGQALSYAVVGIGINLLSQNFPDEIKNIATTVEDECGKKIDINELSALLIKEFFDNLHLVGTKELADEYRSRSFLIGKDVTVIKPTKNYPALVMDITNKCNLILKLADGTIETLSTGEVSIKANPPK